MVFTRHVRGRGGVNGGGVAFSQKAHVKYEVPSGAGKVKAKEEEEEEVVEAGGRGRRNAGGVKLLDMTPGEMKEFVLENDERAFRSAQIETGIFKKRAATVHDIRGLPATFKTRLEEQNVRVGRSSLLDRVIAKDGTVKLLLGLGADGGVIETVGIPASSGGSKPRVTCCVSSQVGCAMRCAFCATGKMGFTRNLSSGEIVDQVLTMEEATGTRVSHVVFMGMGEPMMNLPQVVRAVHSLTQRVGIGARNITISTVGVPNTIQRLASEQLQVTLAVSLHAPNALIRRDLIPAAAGYPIDALLEDCRAYATTTGRRVSFEYTLIDSVNDDAEHARELAAMLSKHGFRNGAAHVNLIPYNPIDGADFVRPSRNRVYAFMRALHANGVGASIRETRGLDAAAACGQLKASRDGAQASAIG